MTWLPGHLAVVRAFGCVLSAWAARLGLWFSCSVLGFLFMVNIDLFLIAT